LKFLLVTGIYPPDIGGPATFIPLLEKYLAGKGLSYKTLTLADNESEMSHLEKEKLIRIKRAQSRLRRSCEVILRIFKEGRSAKYIFANGLHEEVGIALLLIRRKKAIAKIVGDPVWERARNSGKTHLTMQDFNKRKKFKVQILFQRKLLKFSLNRFDLITCPSEELVKIIESWGVQTPVILIQNGVQILPFEKHNPEVDIVSISRLVKWKNIDKLIEFASEGGFSLAIIGTGPEESRLKNLSSRNNNIKFLGDLDRDSISEVLGKSQFFGLFSDYEGLSFSLLESMSRGVVPIVNSNPGNLAVVSDDINGIVISLANLKREVSRILQYRENQWKLNELSLSAYKTCEISFNIEDKLSQLFRLFLDEKK